MVAHNRIKFLELNGWEFLILCSKWVKKNRPQCITFDTKHCWPFWIVCVCVCACLVFHSSEFMANRSRVKWPCRVVLEKNQRDSENSPTKTAIVFILSKSDCFTLLCFALIFFTVSSSLNIIVQPEKILGCFCEGLQYVCCVWAAWKNM